MKTRFLFMLLMAALVASGCSGKKAQQDESEGDIAASKPATTDSKPVTTDSRPAITVIADGWRDKTIAANTTEAEPDVMTLIKAFNEAWPTDVVDSLIAEVGDKRFVSKDVTDDGHSCHVYVDCDDFNCASYDHGDTGAQAMDARVYRRENGHTLFAIRLEQLNPEQKLFCCFYDYDPKTHVMTPEKEPYADLKRKWTDSSLEYSLGEYYDQTIIVLEVSPDGKESVFHHYAFDGMKHTYSSTGNEGYADVDDEEVMTLPNTAVRKDKNGDLELYVNQDIMASDYHPNQWSFWLKNTRTGEVSFLFHTNNDAAPLWEKMKDGNAIRVPLDAIAPGDCDIVLLVPAGKGKVYVEGCPDARNVWSYIYDIETQNIIQFPAQEGLIRIDADKDRISLSAYRYDVDAGRYSVRKEFTLDGKFIKEERINPEE